MASRTVLQLFTLSIIFTNQIEARNFNKTRHLQKNQEYDLIPTSVNKRSDKGKKIYSHFDQRSDTNAESGHDILSRYKYNRKYNFEHNDEAESDKSQAEQQSDEYHKSYTTITSNRIQLTSVYNRKYFTKDSTSSEDISQLNSIDRKLKGVTKLEPNNESSLQNYVEKENPTVKPGRRQKHLTVRHRNIKIRTNQANRQKQLDPKITHKQKTEVENEICKTKHCDYKNHRSFEKTSREYDVRKLKRRDEFKTASKDNKKKVNKNNIKVNRFIESHRSFTRLPLENSEYDIKNTDIKKPELSNTISKENDIYVQKHIDESATKEEPISKQVNPEYESKISHKFQKKKQRGTTVRKVRDTDKSKHNSGKVISNQEKYKPALEENRDSVSDETHTDIRKGENDRNANSGDTFKPDNADRQTLENQDEKETLDSYQSEKDLKKPRLPFYITTKRDKKEKFKKQPNKPVSQKDEMETDILLSNLNIKNQVEEETQSCEEPSEENNFLNKPRMPFYVSSTTKRVITEISKKQPKKPVSQKNEMETDLLLGNPNIKNQDEKETQESREELINENNIPNKPRLSSTTKMIIKEKIKKQPKKPVSQKYEMETDLLLGNPNIKNQDEKEILESREELINENNIPNKSRLSSTTKMVIKEKKHKKQPKKPVSQKDEMETDILLNDLNTVLKGKSDLAKQHIDLNTTMNRLASSKILDFITDRVAGRMLQKLEKSLASNNNLRRTEVYPEKVEQIDIMFKKDGDMVMMGRDPVKEKDEDEYGTKETYHPY